MCKHCDFINKTFLKASDMSPREYWLMTEVFVWLHNGKDYCKDSVSDELSDKPIKLELKSVPIVGG